MLTGFVTVLGFKQLTYGLMGFMTIFYSIEYWPDPQRGIKEAYRVIKKGGKACLIGPVYPTFWLSRFFADMWMLFPKEEEYIEWFEKAGFKDVQIKRIGPQWYRGVRRHGLIMGCSVTGVKPTSGDSPLQRWQNEQVGQHLFGYYGYFWYAGRVDHKHFMSIFFVDR
ncbi:putative 2-methyl-6-phytyl-1,4-hydroquinone methyltransferase [Helianthus annuus]|nr:putative 2-methyl-6-phytyl-1,4-hydroquinone methyltransferase [Helianthus annuus]